MKLDALISFLERRISAAAHQGHNEPLLLSDRLSLAIYRYAEALAPGQWREVALGELGNAVDVDHAILIDRLKDLWEKGLLGLRKWHPEIQRFGSYVSE